MAIRFGRIQKVWLVTFNMLDLWPSAWSLLSWQKNLRFPACLCPINTLLFLPLVDKWKPGCSLFSSVYLHAFALSLFSQFHYCLSPGCLWLESTLQPPFNFLWCGVSRTVSLPFWTRRRCSWRRGKCSEAAGTSPCSPAPHTLQLPRISLLKLALFPNKAWCSAAANNS